MVGEHIIIADELHDHSIEPTNVGSEESIANRVKGVATHLVFYDEGYLRVRHVAKAGTVREHLLELRFLKPAPVVGRRAASRLLWIAMGLGLGALFAAFLLPASALADYTTSAVIACGTLSLVFLLAYVYRREIRFQFLTQNGRVAALTLYGSFGCVRRTRAAARAICEAIVAAQDGAAVRSVDYLRAEMKAHYRLADTGVISRQACSDGTRLILALFD